MSVFRGGDEDELDLRGYVFDEAETAHRVAVQHDGAGLDLLRHREGVRVQQPGKPHLRGSGGLAVLLPVAARDQETPGFRRRARGQDELHEGAVAQGARDFREEQHVLVGIVDAAHDEKDEVDGVSVAGIPAHAPAAPAHRHLDPLPFGKARVRNGDTGADPGAHDSFPVLDRLCDDLGIHVPVRQRKRSRQLTDCRLLGAASQGHDPGR